MQNLFTILVALLLSHICAFGIPTASEVQNEIIFLVSATDISLFQPREAETCADPSLATLYITAFSQTKVAHIIRTQAGLVVGDTLTGSGSGSNTWGYQGPSFLAWDSPQEFTVPFYQLGVNGGDDFIFLPAVNGTPPTVPGFTTWQVVVGYA